MRSKMEILRSQIENSISSVFTKEDILALVDNAIKEEQDSRRIPVTEMDIDNLQLCIKEFLKDFCFDNFIEIDEDDIRLTLYEREIEINYEGSGRLESGFEDKLALQLTSEITDHLFEVV